MITPDLVFRAHYHCISIASINTIGRSTRMRAAALAAVALISCRGESGKRLPADTAAAAAVANRAASPRRIDAEVEATCAAVAHFWRDDSTAVRTVDSLVTPYASDTAVDACVVLVNQEHGMRRQTTSPVDTAAQRLETALALVRGAGPGWIALLHYGADGPDGSTLAYQRGRVRCLVEQTWDGGDDADTTYVAADWFKEQTTCWRMPGGIAVSDTAAT